MVRDSLPEDLQPYEAKLYAMVHEALIRYCRDFGVVRVTTSTLRGERNNIHDCMRAVAKSLFTDYTDAGQTFEINLGDHYCARCKKFSVKLETSNYPTQAVFRFEQQVTTTLFPELEPINIYVGYVPSPILTDSTIWVVQPGPGGWCYQLRADAIATAVPIPPPTDPNVGKPKTRIEPKRTKIRKLTKDTKNEE